MAGLTKTCLAVKTSFGSVSAEHLHVLSNCPPAVEFSYFSAKLESPVLQPIRPDLRRHPGISRGPVFRWKCRDIFETPWLFSFSNDQESPF